ncbi:MAG: bifunctional DNA-binding transcriptional regulator/O6-methylguanine-DNA methyltransferase Ada [Spirochaetae bacterium HGW-Spirochaetae-10]|nr:MAG: bifunctional DNA-binding transcriptional regulator/O6-methylguanine-DNA methyltransferase Ada [Spirochaetae bacterium HGW-Spirochaetae-10]
MTADTASLKTLAEERWNVLISRRSHVPDASTSGLAVPLNPALLDPGFFYGVKTTKIYCRPTCPSKLARRENVVFFDTIEMARRAGFRPCKRCRPDDASFTAKNDDIIAALCRYIDGCDHIPTLQELSQLSSVSPYHLHRLFCERTGLTPRQYAAQHRRERLRSELRKSRSVTDALYQSGYNAGSRFYSDADRTTGMLPSKYRKGGEGVVIRYATGRCSLGRILVAESDRGICAVLFADHDDNLRRELTAMFPGARIMEDSESLTGRLCAVTAHIEHPGRSFSLPLDLQGTVFQRRVWQELQTLSPGTTISYADLARRIGSPDAVRAVAGACAANRHAVVIPCHRVLRSDGSISGYRWGVERKKLLIEREKQSLTATDGQTTT